MVMQNISSASPKAESQSSGEGQEVEERPLYFNRSPTIAVTSSESLSMYSFSSVIILSGATEMTEVSNMSAEESVTSLYFRILPPILI